jgi:pheromone shutdown protein TraB
MHNHPWFWILALFLVPLLAALVVSLFTRKRGISTNAVLAWFVIVCWVGALGAILAQVM